MPFDDDALPSPEMCLHVERRTLRPHALWNPYNWLICTRCNASIPLPRIGPQKADDAPLYFQGRWLATGFEPRPAPATLAQITSQILFGGQ